jgi:hypothetical protein
MNLHIKLSILLFFCIMLGCDDECLKDEPPTTLINYPLRFGLVQQEPPLYLIKESNEDTEGIYDRENVDFLNDQGISVKDSLFNIEGKMIVYQTNEEVVADNLIQNFTIVFSPDYSIEITLTHFQFEGCINDYIGKIELEIGNNSYTLGSPDLVISI